MTVEEPSFLKKNLGILSSQTDRLTDHEYYNIDRSELSNYGLSINFGINLHCLSDKVKTSEQNKCFFLNM